MKHIYFIQVGFDFGGSVYLPSAAGSLIAAASADEFIAGEYDFPEIIFKRLPLAEALDKIKEPFLAAFSCSVWNIEYNTALARLIKQKYPDCKIAFGGHSVPEHDTGLLSGNDFLDFLLLGEGEESFPALLKSLAGAAEIKTVPNLAYRCGDKILSTSRSIPQNLDLLPSPYLTGIYDRIITENPNTDFLCVLETTRGCPYSCAYCDWCEGRKIRNFPLDRVLAEIKWIAEHKITYVFCSDSNFGINERDKIIAAVLVESKRNCGYPEIFRPSYEKNSAERVFEISSLLNTMGMDKGVTMAYQSLCPEALKNVGRKNLTREHFSELLQKYSAAGIPTYSELILGLPGETADSFCDGICALLADGQHNSINVYHCEVLPNSDMGAPEYIKKHGIEVIKIPFNHIHSARRSGDEIPEFSYLVRSTATMPREEWVYSNLFSITTQAFHCLGLTRCISLYLHTEGLLGYREFFDGLLNFILASNTAQGQLFRNFRKKLQSSLSGDWNYNNTLFGDVTWFFEEGAFLEAVTNYDNTIAELLPYFNTLDIKKEILDELTAYNRLMLRRPGTGRETKKFKFNIKEYIDCAHTGKKIPLKVCENTVNAIPETFYDNAADYAREIVWYGRRRGATILKGDELQ